MKPQAAGPIVVPMRTSTGQNAREHFGQRSKRVRAEREGVAWCLSRYSPPPTPCSVLLTRVAPSAGLDDDNLAGALKGARDQVAEWFGVDDRDRMRVRYRYAQRNSGYRGEWAVEIAFGPPVTGSQGELPLSVVEIDEEAPF